MPRQLTVEELQHEVEVRRGTDELRSMLPYGLTDVQLTDAGYFLFDALPDSFEILKEARWLVSRHRALADGGYIRIRKDGDAVNIAVGTAEEILANRCVDQKDFLCRRFPVQEVVFSYIDGVYDAVSVV